MIILTFSSIKWTRGFVDAYNLKMQKNHQVNLGILTKNFETILKTKIEKKDL